MKLDPNQVSSLIAQLAPVGVLTNLVIAQPQIYGLSAQDVQGALAGYLGALALVQNMSNLGASDTSSQVYSQLAPASAMISKAMNFGKAPGQFASSVPQEFQSAAVAIAQFKQSLSAAVPTLQQATLIPVQLRSAPAQSYTLASSLAGHVVAGPTGPLVSVSGPTAPSLAPHITCWDGSSVMVGSPCPPQPVAVPLGGASTSQPAVAPLGGASAMVPSGGLPCPDGTIAPAGVQCPSAPVKSVLPSTTSVVASAFASMSTTEKVALGAAALGTVALIWHHYAHASA
jgi:hypothetical protein